VPPSFRTAATKRQPSGRCEARGEKEREIMNGFYRTCVLGLDRAYIANDDSDECVGESPSKLEEHRQDARVDARHLLDGRVEAARITNGYPSFDDHYFDYWG
jgi:hypothetical protein